MDFENKESDGAEKSAAEEALDSKREAMKSFNINDADIAEKLSMTCGIPLYALKLEMINELREYANEKTDSKAEEIQRSTGWKEWEISETGDTLFINPDGSMGIKG